MVRDLFPKALSPMDYFVNCFVSNGSWNPTDYRMKISMLKGRDASSQGTLYNNKIQKTAKCPSTGNWILKMLNRKLFCLKINQQPSNPEKNPGPVSFATTLNPEVTVLSDMSQSEANAIGLHCQVISQGQTIRARKSEVCY